MLIDSLDLRRIEQIIKKILSDKGPGLLHRGRLIGRIHGHEGFEDGFGLADALRGLRIVAENAEIQAEFVGIVHTGMMGEHIHAFHVPRLHIGQHIPCRRLLFRDLLQVARLGIESLLAEDDPAQFASVKILSSSKV